ncbi:MAG: tetratricopeptide repeat protein [Nannocystales bacterium]
MSLPQAEGDEGSFDTRMLGAEPDSAEIAAFAPFAEPVELRLPPRLAPGTILADTFEIEEVVGAGGMGIVYRARDLQLGRSVALKLHRPMARGTERLMREAASMAKLTHPNVATVHEVGTHEGMLFIAMEFIEGVTARGWLTQVERTPTEIVALYHAAGQGLAAAHRAGLVHRDFKPENVLVDADGVPRVVDFGLARPVTEPSQPTVRNLGSRSTSAESFTLAGAVMGTPVYMAPEQFNGAQVDARADQFSFCVSLYEAMYGERPFAAHSIDQLALAVNQGEIGAPPSGARVSLRLRRVVLRGLAPKPGERWPSMDALLEQLGRELVPRARRWMLPSLVVGGLGVGGGLALGSVVEERERCTDPHRHLANIWDDGRRAEVKAAILGTGLNYAPGTWQRVEQRLDDYADAWASMHTVACEASTEDAQATRDRRLRLDCMHERSRTLRATVDVLARADAQAVENAVELTTGLPGVDRCDDLEALRATVPPPEDPAVRREVEALRERLADVVAAKNAGKYRSSLEEAERVVQDAEGLGYGPLVAEAKQVRGLARRAKGKYEEAEQDLQEAHELAMEHRHDEVALHTAQHLASVVGVDRQRHAEGSVWGQVAVTHAKRSQQPIELAASLDRRASILDGRGEYEAARRDLETALEMLEAALGPDHLELASSLNNLGTVLWHQGEYELALSHHERALRIREQALGADHPVVAVSLTNIGVVFRAQGRYAPAVLHHQRALQILERALGDDHPKVATSLDNMGVVFMDQAKYAQAQSHYERALRIRERSLGADHPGVANALGNLGGALKMQGEYAQSRLRHERALRIREQALGPDHSAVADSLHNLAVLSHDEGDLEQAVRHYERALAIVETSLGAEHPEVARTLTSLAVSLGAQQKYAEARRHDERALAISQKSLGPNHPMVASILNNLGHGLMAEGDYEQARGYLERAVRVDEQTRGADHPAVAYPLSSLAKVALAEGDFEGARAHAERALSIRESHPVAPEQLAKARFILARALWSEPSQRDRARALAAQALDALVEVGGPHEDIRAEVEGWLAKRPK